MLQQLRSRRIPKSNAVRGMTLIEIMVVITILGMIAAAVVVAVVPALQEAKEKQARIDIANIENAIKLYYMSKGKYPDTGEGIGALVSAKKLDKVPKDPWGHDYIYVTEGNGAYTVMSYGGDGQQGGDGDNADITNKDDAAKK